MTYSPQIPNPTPHLSPSSCQIADDPESFAVRVQIKQDRDVLSTRWLEDCLSRKRRLAPAPRHFVHLSQAKV